MNENHIVSQYLTEECAAEVRAQRSLNSLYTIKVDNSESDLEKAIGIDGYQYATVFGGTGRKVYFSAVSEADARRKIRSAKLKVWWGEVSAV